VQRAYRGTTAPRTPHNCLAHLPGRQTPATYRAPPAACGSSPLIASSHPTAAVCRYTSPYRLGVTHLLHILLLFDALLLLAHSHRAYRAPGDNVRASAVARRELTRFIAPCLRASPLAARCLPLPIAVICQYNVTVPYVSCCACRRLLRHGGLALCLRTARGTYRLTPSRALTRIRGQRIMALRLITTLLTAVSLAAHSLPRRAPCIFRAPRIPRLRGTIYGRHSSRKRNIYLPYAAPSRSRRSCGITL